MGREETFNQQIQLEPKGERKIYQGFSDSSKRHTAIVQFDGRSQQRGDVTSVARNRNRYTFLVKSYKNSSFYAGDIHVDGKVDD